MMRKRARHRDPELARAGRAGVELAEGWEIESLSGFDSGALRDEDADTARLVSRAQQGDASSFDELFRRYRGRVHDYLASKLKDPHEAEDVTQDVFERVRKTLPHYTHNGVPWRAWLFAIARNCAVSALRRRPTVELVEPLQLNLRREVFGSVAPAPQRLGWIGDDVLMKAVGSLPGPQQQVLVLRFGLDQSIADTARLLARTEGAVKVLQHRAVLELRRRMVGLGRDTRGTGARRHAAFVRRSRGLSPVLRRRRQALSFTL